MGIENIKVVIGANFGDEGKGLMTDYYCSQLESPLNVRFNGGAQAGHTVVNPDGKRHIFHSVGAGSFNPNTSTYLSSTFLISPIELRAEMEALRDMGLNPHVIVSDNCRLVLPPDCFINMALERSRGEARHGSCGMGIWEAVLRNGYRRLSFSEAINHLVDFTDFIHSTYDKYWEDILNKYEIDTGKQNVADVISLMHDNSILEAFKSDLLWVADNCEISSDTVLLRYKNIVFEGAQGLILDRGNKLFWPNLSASNTGLRNVQKILANIGYNGSADIETCYTTRSYFTRHGAGRFISECEKAQLGSHIYDYTNITNEFQGSLRFGLFDLGTFRYFVSQDIKQFDIGGRKVISVTHLDQTNGMIPAYKTGGKCLELSTDDLSKYSGLAVRYTSYGETREDIRGGA